MNEGERNPFDHPKNIKRGEHGRILWASGGPLQPGAWILPGGRLTTCPEEAAAAARLIDVMHKAHEARA
jgi:hypothetical protein